MRSPTMLLLLLCSLLPCFTVAQGQINFQALLIPEDLKDNADAIVRLDQMEVEIRSLQDMVLRSKRIVTVLNRNGNRFVQGYGGYDNSRKLKKIEAVIYDAIGKEVKKVKMRDFKDVSAVQGGTLYSDSRVKYLEHTPTTYPYTVVIEKETQTKNTVFVPNWYFMDGYGVSTQKSSYKISCSDPSMLPVIKKLNWGGHAITEKTLSNGVSFEAKDLKAFRHEEMSPDFGELVPKILVRIPKFNYEGYTGQVDTWSDLGAWMHTNILNGRDEIPETLKDKLQNLVKDAESDLEKARIVYEFMQSNTRYISVQVGIGGIQPIAADEVDRVKYGDCKGLSNYTHAMLDAVGVTSYYVHVEAGRDKVDFETDFPSLEQGNHAILAIPTDEGYTWIDCTSQVHPFGFVGDFTDDRKVFVITPEGGEIVKTPAYLEGDNTQITEARVRFKADGSLKAQGTIETQGVQYDNRFHLEDTDADDVLEHYQDYWSYINNLKLVDNSFENNKGGVAFTEKIDIEAAGFGTISGDRLLFPISVLSRNTHVPKRYRNRKLPFELQRGYLDTDSYTISLPEGYTIESLPENKTLENEFGKYELTIEKQGNGQVKFQRSILIRAGAYPKEKYKDYRSFRRAVAKLEKSKLVLIKS